MTYRRRTATVESRANISLELSAHRHPQTTKRRTFCLTFFITWLADSLEKDISLGDLSTIELNTALIAFGKHLFYSGEPRYIFAECINAIVDLQPHLRGQLWPHHGAHCLGGARANQELGSMIKPASVLKAAVALSLLWGWPRFGAALLLGCHGLLRPNEFLSLLRSDLILPQDVLSDEKICYVRILHSKTSRFMLRQHARVSDVGTVCFLERLFGASPRWEPLFGASLNVFRNRWNHIFHHLGIPTSERRGGVTPKSLRGSGASWLFHHTEDVERVLWRGRWQSRRTLEFYLQDVMGQVLVADLEQSKQDLISELAHASAALLVESCAASGHHATLKRFG